MSHHIQIIIAKEEWISNLSNLWATAHKLALKQGFALIPITDELLHDISELANNNNRDFCEINSSLNQLLKSKSQKNKIAYIETEYFGGVGSQLAIMYENNDVTLGPLKTETIWNENTMDLEIKPKNKMAINQVLEQIGVKKIKALDEFDSIELGSYRSNSKIIKIIKRELDSI